MPTPRVGLRFLIVLVMLVPIAACSTSEVETVPTSSGAGAPDPGPGSPPFAEENPPESTPRYLWHENPAAERLADRFVPPEGFRRVDASPESFATWIRRLPVRPGRSEVRLHDGRPKARQDLHAAVLDIDVGGGDLQQCADAVIRLRAEYLFARGCESDIAYDFTSGDRATWLRWKAGHRPEIAGSRVSWRLATEPDGSYRNFRRYLTEVFRYAGSISLSRELRPVEDPAHVRIGDVFIQGGSPGHAVLVVDVAENESGERVFLVAQSYMPAQDIHVLKAPDEAIGPWYRARSAGPLRTPQWTFDHRDLRRFPASLCSSETSSPNGVRQNFGPGLEPGELSSSAVLNVIGIARREEHDGVEEDFGVEANTPVVRRDPRTRADIRRTAHVALPERGAGALLQLVVTKSRYRLDAFLRDEILKTYPVALGGSPVGPKRVRGDERTPEGVYGLIPHHDSPRFGRCFYVCYPNEADADRGLAEGLIDTQQHTRILRALRRGLRPPDDSPLGGLILLHGTRNRLIPLLTSTNWTNGCIAMENDHLLELLEAFGPGDRPTLTVRP